MRPIFLGLLLIAACSKGGELQRARAPSRPESVKVLEQSADAGFSERQATAPQQTDDAALRERYSAAYFVLCGDRDAGIGAMLAVYNSSPRGSQVRALALEALAEHGIDAGVQ
jgi:hypothetical protein